MTQETNSHVSIKRTPAKNLEPAGERLNNHSFIQVTTEFQHGIT